MRRSPETHSGGGGNPARSTELLLLRARGGGSGRKRLCFLGPEPETTTTNHQVQQKKKSRILALCGAQPTHTHTSTHRPREGVAQQRQQRQLALPPSIGATRTHSHTPIHPLHPRSRHKNKTRHARHAKSPLYCGWATTSQTTPPLRLDYRTPNTIFRVSTTPSRNPQRAEGGRSRIPPAPYRACLPFLEISRKNSIAPDAPNGSPHLKPHTRNSSFLHAPRTKQSTNNYNTKNDTRYSSRSIPSSASLAFAGSCSRRGENRSLPSPTCCRIS